jgi:four helix bundle protein
MLVAAVAERLVGSKSVKEDRVSTGSRDRPVDIVSRTAAFADRIVKMSFALPNKPAGWEIGRQIVRAGLSIGANVEEAQAGESRADFLHKMKISRKECREVRYFLARVAAAELLPRARLRDLQSEADQLLRILTSIIKKTEAGGRK